MNCVAKPNSKKCKDLCEKTKKSVHPKCDKKDLKCKGDDPRAKNQWRK